MPHALECISINKNFGDFVALRGVNLTLQAGQIVALLGPSGGGKTTTLRLIAGFEWPDRGTIRINGRTVASETDRIPPEDRRVGMVFQEYALFPHLDVSGNIAFGLRGNSREKQQRMHQMLTLVGLNEFAQRMPFELSGGQQQRVALARALAPQPDILLLDEPFSNLDTALRVQVRTEVRTILKKAGITCVFVTHDQEEALSLADKVAVMLNGQIAQIDEPQQLYRRPNSRAVAAFVGESNFLPGEAQGSSVMSTLGRLVLEKTTHGRVEVLIRPEMLRLSDVESDISGEILWREFYGHDQRMGVQLQDGTMLIARADSEQVFVQGQRVNIQVIGPVQVFPL